MRQRRSTNDARNTVHQRRDILLTDERVGGVAVANIYAVHAY